MTLEAAKAIADKPQPSPSPEVPGLPVRSDHILIDILIHLTQNVAEPRIYCVRTHSDIVCRTLLLV